MPKTNKRAEMRRAAKLARAHATKLPEEQVKDAERHPRSQGSLRGIARYPWAITLALLLVASGIIFAYVNHVGPFGLPTAGSSCVQSSILSQITDTSAAPGASDIQKITHTYSKEPAMSIDQQKVYCAGINTNRGLIVVELDPTQAPHTVNNFVFLAQHHYFDGLKFHRVLPGVIIQSGDPQGDGSGGPGYTINDEPIKGNYTAGTIAMAKTSAPNSAGSQFFINLADNSNTFPKSYTIFGHVVQGLDVAKKVQGPGDDPSSKNIAPDIMNHVIVVAAP